jgi:hypothetical protein
MVRNFITVAAALTEDRLARQGRKAVGKIAIVAAAALVASVGMMGAVGCALWALWIYALPLAGPVGAPLIVAVVLLALSITVLLAARHLLRSRRRNIRLRPLLGESLSHEAATLFKDQKSALLLGALLAGVVAGSSKK